MKKINLENLELKLPKIDEKNSKILLGGNGYGEFEAYECHGQDLICVGGDGDDSEQIDDYSDGRYDLDVGLDDNFQDVDDYSYDDGYDTGDPNDGGNPATPITTEGILANFPESFFDGISADNPNIIFDFPNNPGTDAFEQQLMMILQSSDLIEDLADQFVLGRSTIRFELVPIANTVDPVTGNTLVTQAQTITEAYDVVDGEIVIQFNSNLIGPDGWMPTGGTPDQSLANMQILANTIAHEILHANNFHIIQTNYAIHGNPYDTYNALIDQGYSVEYAQIWFDVTSDGMGGVNITWADDITEAEYNYFDDNNTALLNSIVDELASDMNALKNHLNNLRELFATSC